VKSRRWLIPFVWAVGGGLLGYLAISSYGAGAADTFQFVGEPYDPQKDFFARREARHRLVGAAACAVGLAAGLVLVRLRSRWVGAAVGGVAGAAIGLGPYWDIGQPDTLPLAKGTAACLAALGLPVGFATVRQTAETGRTRERVVK